MSDLALEWSAGPAEQSAERTGLIVRSGGQVPTWERCVLLGPNIGLGTVFAKSARTASRHQQDYDDVNLELLDNDAVPITTYLASDTSCAGLLSGTWQERPELGYWRVVARKMLASNTYRSTFSALLPPGTGYTSVCYGGILNSEWATIVSSGVISSLPIDYLLRVRGSTALIRSVALSIPMVEPASVSALAIGSRVLQLNSLTARYEELWNRSLPQMEAVFESGLWFGDSGGASGIQTWSMESGLRDEHSRWRALIEIDVLVALAIGLDEPALQSMYRSQFPVLRKYEYETVFDAAGRKIAASWREHGWAQATWEAELKSAPNVRGEKRMGMWERVQAYIAGDTEVDLGPFVPPFVPADREAAMSKAYQAFEARLAEA